LALRQGRREAAFIRASGEAQQEGRSLGSGGESVEIKSASKHYGAVVALDNVTLNVAPREFVSLLGPSGSGKTTLLGLLGGFIQPTSGSIHFGERDVTLEPPHKRNIGVVFQNYALFPHMSVGENVAFPLRARRLPKADWPAKVRGALAMVGLAGYEERGVAQLSGGQRQRVALARAMIFEPRLILMDEPLSALDKQLRESMQIELRQLHKRIGATIIYVTHDQREALTMSDRVAVVNGGRIVQLDTPRVLYEQPASRFVAEFIGESNLLAAQRDGDVWRCAGQLLRHGGAMPAGDRALLMLRPERVRLLADSDAAEGLNVLQARIGAVIYQGESVLLQARLADGSAICARGVAHTGSLSQLPEAGQAVRLGFGANDTVLLPDERP
jgi:putative spermidine/putrescine transport system ATP-binding protein